MDWIEDFENEVYIKYTEEPSILMTNLARHLGIEDFASVGKVIATDAFYLKLYDNRYKNGPHYYYTLEIENDFFTHFIDFKTKMVEEQFNADLINQILGFFWDQGIPAATRFDDFNHLLPMEGGNDIEQIFWHKDQLSQ